MGFTVILNLDGVERKLDTIAMSAADLEVPLRKFGAYLRAKAIAKYESQNFAPLAKATLEKRASKGIRQLENKLRYDLKRALRRQPAVQVSALEQLVGAQDLADRMASREATTKGAQNRLAVYQEFRRRYRDRDPENSFENMAGARALSVKALASLDARENRAIARAVGAPILGRLVKSLVVEVSGGSLTLTSRSKGHWTEVHNEGDVAGHGAQIPQRQTIALEDRDVAVLTELITDWVLHGAFDASDMIPGAA